MNCQTRIQNIILKETQCDTREYRQLDKIRKAIYQQNKKFSKELKIIYKNQTEILEV